MNTQVVTLANSGRFDSLALTSAVRPSLRPNEVEIEVDLAGLNFKDVLLALGLVPTAEGDTPSFGFECVGHIREVGAQVTSLAIGDEVVAIGTGCLATSVCVSAETVRRKPRDLDQLDAVTLPVAFVTASYALEELARLRMGERVLIHAATGGVGLAAIQIAQHTGAEIFATAGSEQKREHLRSLGIAHVMDSRTSAFAEEVLAQTDGVGVDVVLNSLSGELMERSLAVLAPHGRFIELGARDAVEGRALALSLFARGASFCAVGYAGAIPRLGSRLSDVMARAEIGEFKPLPRKTFSVADVEQAFSHLARARHIGKVVVAMRGEVPIDDDAAEDDPTRDFLLPVEGVEIFELCLAAGRAHTVVSKTPLEPRLAKRSPLPPAVLVNSLKNGSTPDRLDTPETHRRRHPRSTLEVDFMAPRSAGEAKIAEIWARCLGIEAVGVNDDFFALGGDSLLAAQLAHQLRAALQVDLPSRLLLEHPTVGALSARLGQALPGLEVSRHLVRLAAGSASAPPIFFVHPVGGHVYFYMPLARGLADVAPVYGIQARGVDGEAPPVATIEEMAASYVAAIRSVQPRGPYRIGGSSFGGVVAFEMAQQLTRAKEAVELLALIDSPGPGALPSGFGEDAEILAYLLARGSADDRHLQALSTMSHDDMLLYFLRHGGAEERLSPEATVDGVRHFLRLFRVNLEALLRYEPRPYQGNAIFFRASEPDGFNPPGLERAWAPLFQSMELVMVPGNHTTMNLPPYVDAIVQRLLTLLSERGAS